MGSCSLYHWQVFMAGLLNRESLQSLNRESLQFYFFSLTSKTLKQEWFYKVMQRIETYSFFHFRWIFLMKMAQSRESSDFLKGGCSRIKYSSNFSEETLSMHNCFALLTSFSMGPTTQICVSTLSGIPWAGLVWTEWGCLIIILQVLTEQNLCSPGLHYYLLVSLMVLVEEWPEFSLLCL